MTTEIIPDGKLIKTVSKKEREKLDEGKTIDIKF